MKNKKVFIAGATGSIGVNVLKCIEHLNALPPFSAAPYRYEIVGLAVGSNITLLFEQIKLVRLLQKNDGKENSLKAVSIQIATADEQAMLKRNFADIAFFNNIADAIDLCDFDLLINGIMGSAGLIPTVRALEKNSDVAIANKETLVIAGELVTNLAAEKNASIIPIDSEHSAIFSLISDKTKNYLKKIILTTSGGPFFKNKIANPTVEQALNHPTWKMGAKISIDSATMMNKSLEVIEAHYLFNVAYDDIEVVVHPQSIVHSLIETIDGELYAKLGHNDMRQPIQNALTYPVLCKSILQRFELWKIETLNFYPFNHEQFPVLKIAIECGKKGGSALVVLNAANEALVSLFLNKKINFIQIISLLEQEIAQHTVRYHLNLEDILQLDAEIKEKINKNFS